MLRSAQKSEYLWHVERMHTLRSPARYRQYYQCRQGWQSFGGHDCRYYKKVFLPVMYRMISVSRSFALVSVVMVQSFSARIIFARAKLGNNDSSLVGFSSPTTTNDRFPFL